ncbi:unnamed protein product [Rhodiola kirilowii]
MESNNQQQFWQFSDKLRGSNHLAPSPINNDSIWSTTYVSKRTDLPRNNNNNNAGFQRKPSLQVPDQRRRA